MAAALLLTHLFACLWFFAAKIDDFGPDTWVYRKNLLDVGEGQ